MDTSTDNQNMRRGLDEPLRVTRATGRGLGLLVMSNLSKIAPARPRMNSPALFILLSTFLYYPVFSEDYYELLGISRDAAKLQNTGPLIYISLNDNSAYYVIPRSSKDFDTCKTGGPKWPCI